MDQERRRKDGNLRRPKLPKSESCWSLSKLDCYLHRMRPSGTARARTGMSALTFSLLRALALIFLRPRIKGPGVWVHYAARSFKRTHCPRNSVCAVNYGLGQRTSSYSRLRLCHAFYVSKKLNNAENCNFQPAILAFWPAGSRIEHYNILLLNS